MKSVSIESFALVMVLVDDCRNKVNTQIALISQLRKFRLFCKPVCKS